METKILAAGDIHAPYVSPEAVAKCLELISQTRPKVVLQVGDAYELDNFSNWTPHGERESAAQELIRGREVLQAFWAAVRRYSPKSRCIQMYGNHDDRLLKRIYASVPGAAVFVRRGFGEMMAFPGVETHDEEVVDLGFGWSAVHGHHGRAGAHATQYVRNIICGHLHRGYCVPVQGGFIELNAGWLGEVDHHSKLYAKARRQGWQHGVGIVDELGPRFVKFQDGL